MSGISLKFFLYIISFLPALTSFILLYLLNKTFSKKIINYLFYLYLILTLHAWGYCLSSYHILHDIPESSLLAGYYVFLRVTYSLFLLAYSLLIFEVKPPPHKKRWHLFFAGLSVFFIIVRLLFSGLFFYVLQALVSVSLLIGGLFYINMKNDSEKYISFIRKYTLVSICFIPFFYMDFVSVGEAFLNNSLLSALPRPNFPPFFIPLWFFMLSVLFISDAIKALFKKKEEKIETLVNLYAKEKQLTQRELEILKLVIDGQSNQLISDQLFISLSTTKTHLKNIFKKCEVSSRFELSRKIELL